MSKTFWGFEAFVGNMFPAENSNTFDKSYHIKREINPQ